MSLSPNGKYVALAFTDSSLDPAFGKDDTLVQLYEVAGKLVKSFKTNNVGALAFSNASDRFYYSSGKQLICYSSVSVNGKDSWSMDDTYSWYTESGAITAISLSADDKTLAYCTSNGHNKVVKAAFGNDVIKCILDAEDKMNVSK